MELNYNKILVVIALIILFPFAIHLAILAEAKIFKTNKIATGFRQQKTVRLKRRLIILALLIAAISIPFIYNYIIPDSFKIALQEWLEGDANR